MAKFALQVCAYVIGIPLEILIIAALLRGAYRQFPLALAYMSMLLVSTLAETPAYIIGYGFRNPSAKDLFVTLYWFDERVLLGLVFLLVIALIFQATTHMSSRRVVHVGVTAGAVLFAAVSFYIHYHPALKTGAWMTPWTGSLNFGAAVLDLALWMSLIGARKKDQRLLMLSGGLGIQFTGEAIGESIRNLSLESRSASLSLVGGALMIVTNLSFLYVWLQAFRTAPRPDFVGQVAQPAADCGIGPGAKAG